MTSEEKRPGVKDRIPEQADPASGQRLNKFLTNAGVCSRREADRRQSWDRGFFRDRGLRSMEESLREKRRKSSSSFINRGELSVRQKSGKRITLSILSDIPAASIRLAAWIRSPGV